MPWVGRETTMNNPRTFTQIKWFAIFLAAFFTISGFVGYNFVKNQINQIVLTGLAESTNQVDRAVHYSEGINICEYNKRLLDSSDYFVVLGDGYLFDNGVGSKGVPQGLLPDVVFTGDEKSLYAKPIQYVRVGPTN